MREPMTAALPPTDAALSLRGVTRAYAGRRVLGPVGLDVVAGAVALVEGPNGSGKTTLLRIAAGLLTPSTGSVRRPRRAVYLRPGAGARAEQTVGQALGWAAAMSPRERADVSAAVEMVGLATAAHTRVAALSAGQRARLSIAAALVTDPDLACLDEPTSHLDAAGRADAARALAVLLRRGCALLVATHDPADLAAIADARLRLSGGRMEEHP
ncbi:ABC transporter ATP-binding protein [Nocardiopsis tropica]|uniref:ATP-binding cassette domain-containing protein n=1 Tax=Nocardiopsis tropica TaxID=109330 RepID=A0ABU7KK50_9ACTN|nr:ATP-binding cassette domain-containing protein [Nocardiopsis umidischolae]MEE2049676.1 ATP-binding cassette domain-containing protein [Nocardiopsis umidischolae]